MASPPDLLSDPDLQSLAERLPEENWRARVEQADAEAALLAEVARRVQSGQSRGSALAQVLPDRPVRTTLARLRRYQQGGRDALIDRRAPTGEARRKVTPEVSAALKALAIALPERGSAELTALLGKSLGVELGDSTVRVALQELGLSRPRGRPTGSGSGPAAETPAEEVTPLALAGAELLKAVEEELGAVRALTRAQGLVLEELPAPASEVQDDRAHRDDHGRFLPEYNAAKSRTEPELGGKFDTVQRRRGEKDLREMRVANSSFWARYRKDLALVLLPVVVDTARWSSLQHWYGRHLEELVGIAYQPSTLDKHVRELKLAGTSEAARDAVLETWTGAEGAVEDPQTGAVVVYGDATTKPLWTRHFTRCTKVSQTGRVMPATSTLMLNSGAGTPLIYRSFSGHVSMPAEVVDLLEAYEKAAGEGTARRVVVMDREAHAAWLFKQLEQVGWRYIVPLRSHVTGPNARFEERTDWALSPQFGPDQVCEGWLWLNDSRPGQDALRVRVVGRRRHRTDKVAWFATNARPDAFPPDDVLRLYFNRWPLQEQRFRDGSGRVGLDRHHGYGRMKIDNVAVLDRRERLLGQLRRLQAKLADIEVQLAVGREDRQRLEQAVAHAAPRIGAKREAFDAALAAGKAGAALQEGHRRLLLYEGWLRTTQDQIESSGRQLQTLQESIDTLQDKRSRKEAEAERLAGQLQIFTVDTELDEIMTAYKLTFMNLAAVLMDDYLGVRMQLDTLIPAVLRLPGERAVTQTTETVRIYDQPRDPDTMAAVRQACERLTALGLTRGNAEEEQRALRFEVVPNPAAPPRDRSGSG